MFILELSDSEHKRKGSEVSGTGDITSELSSPQWEPLTKARSHQHACNTHTLSHHHLQRGPTTLQQSLAPRQRRGKRGF